jgi:hypothetical protein
VTPAIPTPSACRSLDGLALDGGELVTQLGHALLELMAALVEFGEALGGHLAAGFAAPDGLQHALALLAAPLLLGCELRPAPS